MEFLMVPGFLVFIFFLFYLGNRKDIRQQTELCEHQARKFGGYVERGFLPIFYPTLVLPCCGYSVTIKMHPQNKNSTPAQTTAHARFTGSRHISIVIAEGFMNFAGILSGSRRAKTGDRVFDRKFKINTTDELFLRSFLSASIHEQLLQLSDRFAGCRLSLTAGMFELRVNRLLEREQDYGQFIECAFACLKKVDACTQIRTVVFGDSIAATSDDPNILWNPDVLTLDIPLFGLEKIEIHAASYDFHATERFLTYALDAIGQKHLKTLVDVVVIGEIALLNPNLRNSFANICRRMIHEEQHT